MKVSATRNHKGSAATAKPVIRDHFDALAAHRHHWLARNRYFYETDRGYMRFLVPEGLRVLDIGCGTGDLLAALRPSLGVGLDLSPTMIEYAERRYPHLKFSAGDVEEPDDLARLHGPFDAIILSDTVGYLEDCESTFLNLHRLCTPETRLVVAYYERRWEPVLRLAALVRQMMPSPPQSWLATADIVNLLSLADYEVIRTEWRQLLPKRLLGIGSVLNRFVAPLPFIRRLCLRTYIVARPRLREGPRHPASVTVVIPCRNERGNIKSGIRRLPRLVDDLEILFVEGHSTDGTFQECLRVKEEFPDRQIRVLSQDGKGKADAVRKGFIEARGDILMILDADLSTPPESLPKFYRALVSGRGEFVNGTRLIYPMDRQAMGLLNFFANRAFATILSYLLGQRFTDTLCGSKALWRRDYLRITAGRAYFGEFDPFGDFDLLFGAAKLNLKILEIPVRYASRTYGQTQISRFSDGWLLLRMVVFAWRKLKAI